MLHRQIGEALERIYANNMDAHLPELAHHFYQAAPGGDVQKAIGYARRAGDRAMSQLAYEEAVNQYQLAQQALDLAGDADARLRYEILASLTEAYRRTDQVETAIAVAENALAVAEGLGDTEIQSRAALAYVDAINRGGAVPLFKAVPALERALAARASGDAPMTAQLLARLSSARFSGNPGGLGPKDPQKHLETALEAKEIADRTGDVMARLYAIIISTMRCWGRPVHRNDLLSQQSGCNWRTRPVTGCRSCSRDSSACPRSLSSAIWTTYVQR